MPFVFLIMLVALAFAVGSIGLFAIELIAQYDQSSWKALAGVVMICALHKIFFGE